MQIKKNVMKAVVAGAVMLVSAGAAFAVQATATTHVNVRSGPGGGYGVVDSLRRGDRVEVQECQAGWCYVQKRGPDGWVSSQYLQLRGNGGYGNNYGGGYNARPNYSFEFNFGNAPAPRPQPQPPRPPRPDHGGWNNNGGHNNGGWNSDWDRDDRSDEWPRGWN